MSDKPRMVDDDLSELEEAVAEISLTLRGEIEDRLVFMTVTVPAFYDEMEQLIQKYNVNVSAFSVDMVNKSDLKDAGSS